VTAPIGVGFLGAGPVTQAIHAPALATFGDRFRIVKVMDVEESVARTVAERSAAIATTRVVDVLDDPEVEVVAVNSPGAFHAEQVVAACAAGKRAILCEKPLVETAEDARRVAAASVSSQVPIVVGTMHSYDPAVVAALSAWAEVGERAHFVRSLIYLPHNDVFTQAATDLAAPSNERTSDPRVPTIRDAILGLAIHAVPLVRRLFPDFETVAVGRSLDPTGYFLTLRDGRRTAQMIGLVPSKWRPDWTLLAVSDRHELSIGFPPSFVLAGSATAELAGPKSTRRWSFEENGYQAEWAEIEAIVRHEARPRIAIDEAVSDLDYALRLIEGTTTEQEPA
jgi:myo-inositol 2-dehydrogenase/D-chiro-inositol 1-dehydrogenase